jgi:sulfoxide reductase heme-binding subunit YedZ
VNEQFWWFVARSSGMVAAVLIGVTVVWGLLLSTRIVVRKGLPAWLTDLHRGRAGLSVVFVLVHLVALWADSYEEFTVAELLVPFASDWEPTAVAWGVFATWLLAVVQVTSLLQRRMSRRRWHAVHLLSFPLGVLVGVHAMTAGTDASNPWFRWVTLGLAAAVLFLTIYRVLMRGDRSARRPLPASARGATRRKPPVVAAAIDPPPDPIPGGEPAPLAPVLRPPPYRGPGGVAASEPGGALR